MTRAADLVGTWRLVRWEAGREDGSSTLPFGADANGYVVYTSDGRMITTISRSRRPAIGGNLLEADEAERAEAFTSFVAYAGTYRVEGDEVIHHVEMSLYPDWVGTDQRRHLELSADGTRLTLSTELVSAAGGRVHHRLQWDRVPSEAR